MLESIDEAVRDTEYTREEFMMGWICPHLTLDEIRAQIKTFPDG